MSEMLETLLALASVFAVAFMSFWASFPAGVALGVPPLLVALVAWLSYAVGVMIVVALGEPLRVRLLARFGGKHSTDSHSPLRRIWTRYGLIGLGLLAPITTGGQIGALVGLSLGAAPRRLVIALILGGGVWALVFMGVVLLGLAGAQAL